MNSTPPRTTWKPCERNSQPQQRNAAPLPPGVPFPTRRIHPNLCKSTIHPSTPCAASATFRTDRHRARPPRPPPHGRRAHSSPRRRSYGRRARRNPSPLAQAPPPPRHAAFTPNTPTTRTCRRKRRSAQRRRCYIRCLMLLASIVAVSVLLPLVCPSDRSPPSARARQAPPSSTLRTPARAVPRVLPDHTYVTYNCTAACSLKTFLRDIDAAVVAAQELHVLADGISDLATWALRNHWRPHIEGAIPGVGAGSSGGVGSFVRGGGRTPSTPAPPSQAAPSPWW